MVLFIKVRQVNTNLVNKVNIFFINYKKYRTICKSYRKYIKLKKSINNYLKYNYKIIYLYQQINLLFINSQVNSNSNNNNKYKLNQKMLSILVKLIFKIKLKVKVVLFLKI